jgi:hypothetical protein
VPGDLFLTFRKVEKIEGFENIRHNQQQAHPGEGSFEILFVDF